LQQLARISPLRRAPVIRAFEVTVLGDSLVDKDS